MIHAARGRALLAAPLLAPALAAGAAAALPQVRLEASRTEDCSAPCAVLFDATGTTHPVFTRPFHSLDYRWDFGDERGESWALSGRPKNRAIGAIAGHLFAEPGHFTVRLEVEDPTGASATADVRIRVADPDRVFSGPRTLCVSATADFAGCPEGAKRLGSSDFDASLANSPGTRTLYRRGESFAWDRHVVLVAADGQGSSIGAFGSGERPVIRSSSSNASIDAGSDWRIAHLDFRGTGEAVPGAAPFRERRGVRRFTVYDVRISDFNHCLDFWSPTAPDEEVAFIDVECGAFPDPGNGAKFFEDSNRSMFLGLDIDRGEMRSPDDQTEFAHRSVYTDRKLIQHSRYRGRAPNQSKNALQLRHCTSAGRSTRCSDGRAPSRFVIVSDNHFVEGGGPTGVTVIRVCDHAACTGRPGDSQPVADYIFERNLVQLAPGDPERDGLLRVFMAQGSGITIRNNVLDLQQWPRGRGAQPAFVTVPPASNRERDRTDELWVLHNTVYLGADFSGPALLCSAGGEGRGHLCANNLVVTSSPSARLQWAQGSGVSAEGNLVFGGAAGAADAVLVGPPGPRGASLRDLGGFALRPCAPSAHDPVDGGVDLRARGAGVYSDALTERRRGSPDVGALEWGERSSRQPCDSVKR